MQNLNNFLASVHYLNHPLLSGMSALLILSIGIFVLSRDRKSELYRVFFRMTLVIGIWFLGNALSMFYFNNFKLTLFWWKFGYSGAIFIAISFYHFYLIYFQKKKNILYVLYFISILEVLYLWLPTTDIGKVYLLPNVGLVWVRMTDFSYFLIFGMIKFIILFFIAAIFFLGQYKKASAPLKKQQLKYLTILSFVFIMGTSEWLPTFNIPLHIGWLLTPFIVSLIAYAILKHHLMDINIVIKKVFFYSIGIALVSGLIISISLLSSWFVSKIPGFSFWIVTLIAGAGAFIIGRLFWQKSKEVDKLKYEFITVAAHKLRTPLTEVKWATDALSEKTLSEDEKEKLRTGISSANSRLIILTDELLSIAKTEAGQYQYKFEPVDFEKIVRSMVNDFQHQFKEKGIKLSYHYDKNLPKVNADKIRMPMVIQILLENAITYTKDKIDINIRKDKNEILLSVKDNGIGINKEDLPHIFSRFYRSHDAYLTETEGEGIGLYLAKSIIDKHNAKIGAKSEGKDKGSEFWVRVKIS